MHINSENMISESIRLRQRATRISAQTLSNTHTFKNPEAFNFNGEKKKHSLHIKRNNDQIMFHKHTLSYAFKLANDRTKPLLISRMAVCHEKNDLVAHSLLCLLQL